jgi:predicted lipoprotein with Yx(FWY)xxD motif
MEAPLMKKSTLAFSVIAVLATAGLSVAQQPGGITIATSTDHGEYLADSQGMALYMFEADTQGTGDAAAESACYGGCAEAWPPLLLTDGEPTIEGGDPSLLGTTTRTDGAVQVTYGGWPLYTYARDQAPGDTTGQGVDAGGGLWWLVAPSGEVIR